MRTITKLCMTIAALALSLGTVPAPAAGPTEPVNNIVLPPPSAPEIKEEV